MVRRLLRPRERKCRTERRNALFTLRFDKKFAAPIGAALTYLGTARWRHIDPITGDAVTFSHAEGNSYALDTGGMIGTTWTVVSAIKDHASQWDEFIVTLNPSLLD